MPNPSKTKARAANKLQELVDHLGCYPPDAFLFIREGLAFAVEKAHGPETKAHRAIYEYMSESGMDCYELAALYRAGRLTKEVTSAIHAAGGVEKLNRHVSGRQLCWGLREYALKRWGMLARSVLGAWNITTTLDFGRIVFGFIDLSLMQKQPQDTMEDFHAVYDFEEAFDEVFRAGLRDQLDDMEFNGGLLQDE
jgi:uncharacterized repeat protein (TIGR04138 family)